MLDVISKAEEPLMGNTREGAPNAQSIIPLPQASKSRIVSLGFGVQAHCLQLNAGYLQLKIPWHNCYRSGFFIATSKNRVGINNDCCDCGKYQKCYGRLTGCPDILLIPNKSNA